jgi:hypothetical protein
VIYALPFTERGYAAYVIPAKGWSQRHSTKAEYSAAVIAEKPEYRAAVNAEKPEYRPAVIREKTEYRAAVVCEKTEYRAAVVPEKLEYSAAVIPAKRESILSIYIRVLWIPAFAGMTGGGRGMTGRLRE